MAGLPPYSAHSDFELGDTSLFIVEFVGENSNGLNILGGTFPATDVKVSGNTPLYEDVEIRGIPISIHKGSDLPTEISITFVDSAKDSLFQLLDRWAALGSFDGSTERYKKINRVATLPTSNMKMSVTEFNSRGDIVQKSTYIVQAPADALGKELSSKPDAKSYSLDFKIVGII